MAKADFNLRTNAISFDTETHLIQPGLLTPPLVCGSMASVDHSSGKIHGTLLDRDQTRRVFLEALESNVTIVGANVAFDMGVMAVDFNQRGIDILPQIFRAYREERIFDIQIAEALHAIAGGHLGIDPRTKQKTRDPGTGKPAGYSLAVCTDLVLGRKDAKENDTWRLSYVLLEDLPIDEWPEEARKYPIDDAVNTLEVAIAQLGHENLHDLSTQVFTSWCLHLGAIWGVRTDPNALEELRSAALESRERGFPEFVAHGFVREDGTEDTAVVRRAVAIAYGADPNRPCTSCDNGRVKGAGKATRLCGVCNGTGLDIPADVPRTEPSAAFPNGQIQIGRDTLIESGDDALMAYGASQEDDKLLDAYIPFLEDGVARPINLRPNNPLETGRVSYSGLIQTFPRGISSRLIESLRRRGSSLSGIRECVVPRRSV